MTTTRAKLEAMTDTLEVRGQRIRLWGVDAPDGRQLCAKAGETYRCGQKAADRVSAIMGEASFTCVPQGRPDRYRRVVARCSTRLFVTRLTTTGTDGAATDIDLASRMVREGRAIDAPQYSQGVQAIDQWQAEQDWAGVWAGEFQKPWDWRSR